MGLVDRLKAVIDGMPDGGSVSLPVIWLRHLLDAEGDSLGTGRLLTLEEAGTIVSRSPGTIRTWANSGQLEGAFKLQNRSWRIPEKALQGFIERQQAGEHEAPTVRAQGPVDLSSWRRHVPPGKGRPRIRRSDLPTRPTNGKGHHGSPEDDARTSLNRTKDERR